MTDDKAQQGSTQATETFRQFVSANNEQMWRVVCRYVAVRNLPLDRAEDVYQTALARVWERWVDSVMSYDPEHRLASVYRTMQLVVQEERRKLSHHKQHHLSLDCAETISGGEDVAARALDRTHLAILQRGLLELPAQDRAIVSLAAAGVPSHLIGDQLGLTAEAVRTRLKRTRGRLRAALDPESLHALEIDAKGSSTAGGAA